MTAPDRHHTDIEALVGAGNVLWPPETSAYAVSGCSPAIAAVFPSAIDQVQEIVRFCDDRRLSLLPCGTGTMLSRGARPLSYDVALSTRRMRSVTDYQPENLVFACEAGLTGASAAEALLERRQVLTLDPPRYAQSTMGGIAAARASGPARLQYGTARDLVIGLTVVDASGSIVKTGGKVVKSVSGYDLCKLYTGCMGTLGIIVETVYRLSPLPECSRALVAGMDRWDQADRLTARIMDSVLQPRCLEVMNAAGAVTLSQGQQCPVTLVAGFDGAAEQVQYQCREASGMAESCGAREVAEADLTWNSELHVRLACLEATGHEGALFVLRGLSSDIPVLYERIEPVFRERGLSPLILASAGNGILRIVCHECNPESSRAVVSSLRQIAAGIRGLTLSCFIAGGASHDETWGTDPPGSGVMRGIKQKLDPNGVFVPGRFVGGI